MCEYFGDRHGAEIECSERVRDEIERLRAADRRARRATPAFAEYETVEEMLETVEGCARQDPRPRAWSPDACESNGIWSEPLWPLSDLRAHAARLQRDAAMFCGASALANELLGYVRGSNPFPLAGTVASQVAPGGPIASSIFAPFNGDQRWQVNTSQRAWNRYTAPGRAAMADAESFCFYVTAADRRRSPGPDRS